MPDLYKLEIEQHLPQKQIELPFSGVVIAVPVNVHFHGLEKPSSEKWPDYINRAKAHEKDFVRKLREEYAS